MLKKNYNLLIILMSILICYLDITAQINTEILRTLKPDLGFYHNINFELGVVKGNSDLFRVRTGYRLDFVDSIDRAFGIINFENANAKGKDVINKGFVHLRFLHNFNQPIETEFFAQKEFNDFTRLLDRNVVGTNFRFNLFDYLDANSQFRVSLGNGMMFENEKINQQNLWNTNLIKSNSYLSLFLKYNETITLTNIFYYQMALIRILDRRFLNNTLIYFNINKNLRLNMRLTYFYDKEPPPNLSNYDFELTNGINIDF